MARSNRTGCRYLSALEYLYSSPLASFHSYRYHHMWVREHQSVGWWWSFFRFHSSLKPPKDQTGPRIVNSSFFLISIFSSLTAVHSVNIFVTDENTMLTSLSPFILTFHSSLITYDRHHVYLLHYVLLTSLNLPNPNVGMGTPKAWVNEKEELLMTHATIRIIPSNEDVKNEWIDNR